MDEDITSTFYAYFHMREIIELVGDRLLLWDPKKPECRAMAYGRRGLACGMARVDKPCATYRVPSMEGVITVQSPDKVTSPWDQKQVGAENSTEIAASRSHLATPASSCAVWF
ncbi:hypothetical protein RRG08_039411 [Elysia crispata]|uniref:Uncharacterized protein n=1 Tax=Elysia crispata TaxID=231223 RepID=A0AAE1DW00_9GAST|nr:hypothetical protein RRG08_039411 [Elysia crispata]